MSIPGSANALLLASTAATAGAYQIERSLRFNSSDSAYLSRTPAVAGNRKTWTWAGWVKRSAFGGTQRFFIGGAVGAGGGIQFSSDAIEFFDYPGSYTWDLITTQVFRDTSAWYHILAAIDTTQATSSNRAKVYVNGTQVTAFSTSSYPTLNYDGYVNSTVLHTLSSLNGTSDFFNGYLADIHFIDGQALTPSSFTEVSATTGQLIPKAYTGTFGTNGFWLKFSDNSAATAAALGKDYSGNNNNWTPTNLAAVEANYNPTITSTVGGIAPSIPVSRLFDGNTATLCGTNNAVGANIIFTKTISGVTSLRVFMDHSTTYRARINGGTWYSDSSLGASGNASWRSFTSVLPGNGIITSIESDTNGANNGVNWSAIEVNGVILVNSSSDSLVDTPTSGSQVDTGLGGQVTGNYCTFNPLAVKIPSGSLAPIFANGNLDVTGAANDSSSCAGTFGVSSGKWYIEYTVNAQAETNDTFGFGIRRSVFTGTFDNWEPYFRGTRLRGSDNGFYAAESGGSFSAVTPNGTVIGIAFDIDSNYCAVYVNGSIRVSSNSAGLSGYTWFPYIAGDGGGAVSFNAGQRPFAYTAPSGFKALCDTNLPAPVVAKPNTVMDVALYSGNGSTQTISGLGFSPDLIWIKSRSAAYDHQLADTVRGVANILHSNLTAAESALNTITATTSSGFTVDATSFIGTNANGQTFVAWTWDAGSSTVSNTSGSISSGAQVRANPSSGFSVVTWVGDGTGTTRTVGHGLGVAPSLIIAKNRTSADGWPVYHKELGNSQIVYLNTTAAASTNTAVWNSTSPTSTVFSIGGTGLVNELNYNYVAYCFAPVAGYSSMGSYVANANSDGPFVYTGFKPRFVLCKLSSAAGADWLIFDTARSPYNVVQANLRPNTSSAEESAFARIDILSNGFKLRAGSGVEPNSTNGNTYIYAAWAEFPFQYSRAA